MKLLWLNRTAAAHGGCERAIEAAADLLGSRYDVESILLYELGSPVSRSFTNRFCGAMPVVDLEHQLRSIDADAIFVHRAPEPWLDAVASLTGPRRVAFVHDHDLVCLRRHKTTQLSHEPCTRRSGWACLAHCAPIARGADGLELRSPLTLLRGQRSLARMDAVVAPSSYMVAELARHGVPSARLHRRAPYVELPSARDASEELPNTLFYAGALTRGKGVAVLLDALARLDRNICLDLFGDGPQGDELRERARALGLRARARFHGAVARPEVLDRMRRAAAVVVPSTAPETFGLVGAEALAAEVPVVATAVGGTTEWLTDGRTGLAVQPGDVAGLARAMQRILADRAAARAMARRGRRRVLALCDRDAYGRHLAELLGLRAPALRVVA